MTIQTQLLLQTFRQPSIQQLNLPPKGSLLSRGMCSTVRPTAEIIMIAAEVKKCGQHSVKDLGGFTGTVREVYSPFLSDPFFPGLFLLGLVAP